MTHQKPGSESIENLSRIEKQRDRLLDILQSMGDAVICIDALRAVTFMNAKAEALTGWIWADAEGMPIATVVALIAEGDAGIDHDPVQDCIRTGQPQVSESGYFLKTKNGINRHVGFSIALVKSPSGDQHGVVLIFNDVTEVRAEEKRLAHAAAHDSLTGLPNRASLLASLTAAINSSALGPRIHTLCLIDLDRFKMVNDRGGHAAGDAVLKGIADILHRICPKHHIVARLGGDEFAVLMLDCDGAKAKWFANRIIREIRNSRFVYGNSTYQVGASIGATILDGSHSDRSQLLHEADMACYASKRRGRNAFSLHDRTLADRGQNASLNVSA